MCDVQHTYVAQQVTTIATDTIQLNAKTSIARANLIEAHSYILNEWRSNFLTKIYIALVQNDAGHFDLRVFVNCRIPGETEFSTFQLNETGRQHEVRRQLHHESNDNRAVCRAVI